MIIIYCCKKRIVIIRCIMYNPTNTFFKLVWFIRFGAIKYYTNTRAQASISGGPGISYNSGYIVNSAPDQIVTISGGAAISVSGSYPYFVISYTGITITAGRQVALTGASRGRSSTGGAGGSSVGGAGGSGVGGVSASANTGGGGGGCGYGVGASTAGGNGGSGIIYIRFKV